MKTILNTLEPIIERWDDPGDYPSGAGGGPLPSHKFIAGCDGELVIEMDHSDLIDMARENDRLDPYTDQHICDIVWKVNKAEVVDGKVQVHFIIEECEGDVEEEGPDPDIERD